VLSHLQESKIPQANKRHYGTLSNSLLGVLCRTVAHLSCGRKASLITTGGFPSITPHYGCTACHSPILSTAKSRQVRKIATSSCQSANSGDRSSGLGTDQSANPAHRSWRERRIRSRKTSPRETQRDRERDFAPLRLTTPRPTKTKVGALQYASPRIGRDEVLPRWFNRTASAAPSIEAAALAAIALRISHVLI
jgi:hypothetical protein